MRRWIPFAFGLLVAFLTCFVPHAARADPPTAKTVPVYVLTIWTEDADDQADALTKALRWRVGQAPGWSLMEASQSFETLAIALKCPPSPDAACLQRIGDQLKADHYVWGTVEKDKGAPDRVKAELHLWTRGKPNVTARTALPEGLKDPSDESLRAIASDLFGQLTGAGPSNPPGSPAARTEPAVPLMTQAQEPPPTAPPAGTGRAMAARTALAYTALALGAGFLVAGGVEAANWVSDSNDSANDRQSIPRSVADVCADMISQRAIDACGRSKDAVTASTLAWVFAGVGAALAGTGAWLIATDRGPPEASSGDVARAKRKPRLEVSPSIEPRAGSLDLRVTF